MDREVWPPVGPFPPLCAIGVCLGVWGWCDVAFAQARPFAYCQILLTLGDRYYHPSGLPFPFSLSFSKYSFNRQHGRCLLCAQSRCQVHISELSPGPSPLGPTILLGGQRSSPSLPDECKRTSVTGAAAAEKHKEIWPRLGRSGRAAQGGDTQAETCKWELTGAKALTWGQHGEREGLKPGGSLEELDVRGSQGLEDHTVHC